MKNHISDLKKIFGLIFVVIISWYIVIHPISRKLINIDSKSFTYTIDRYNYFYEKNMDNLFSYFLWLTKWKKYSGLESKMRISFTNIGEKIHYKIEYDEEYSLKGKRIEMELLNSDGIKIGRIVPSQIYGYIWKDVPYKETISYENEKTLTDGKEIYKGLKNLRVIFTKE